MFRAVPSPPSVIVVLYRKLCSHFETLDSRLSMCLQFSSFPFLFLFWYYLSGCRYHFLKYFSFSFSALLIFSLFPLHVCSALTERFNPSSLPLFAHPSPLPLWFMSGHWSGPLLSHWWHRRPPLPPIDPPPPAWKAIDLVSSPADRRAFLTRLDGDCDMQRNTGKDVSFEKHTSFLL